VDVKRGKADATDNGSRQRERANMYVVLFQPLRALPRGRTKTQRRGRKAYKRRTK